MTTPSASSIETEAAVRERLKQLREDELLDVVRDTVQQLHALTDRLEAFIVDKGEGRA